MGNRQLRGKISTLGRLFRSETSHPFRDLPSASERLFRFGQIVYKPQFGPLSVFQWFKMQVVDEIINSK